MRRISTLLTLSFMLAAPVMASEGQEIDLAQVRAKYYNNVVSEQLPAYLGDKEAIKTNIIAIGDVTASVFDSHTYLLYHKLAYQFLLSMDSSELTKLAMALYEKTKYGEPLKGDA